MADLGLSQARQVENPGHSPAGQTGLPTGSSGNSYGAALDTSQPSGNASFSESPYTQLANDFLQSTAANNYMQGVSDTITITDATTVMVNHVVTASITGSASVSATANVQHKATCSITGTSSMTASAMDEDHVFVSDTVTITDSLTAHCNHTAVVSCTGSASVSANATCHYAATTTCLANSALTANATAHDNVAASDTVTISESLSFANHYSANVSDTVTVSDALAFQLQVHENLSESVTVSEAATEHQALHVGPSESISISDAASVGRHNIVGVNESVSIVEAEVIRHSIHATLTDTFTVIDSVSEGETGPIHVADTVGVTEALGIRLGIGVPLVVSVVVEDTLSAGSGGFSAIGTQLTVSFPQTARIDGVPNLSNYSITVGDPAFPVTLLDVTPVTIPVASGTNASCFSEIVITGGVANTIYVVEIPTVNFLTSPAKYVFLNSPTNPTSYLRIVKVLNATTVQVDKPVITDPMNGSILWQLTTGVSSLVFTTTKFTNGGVYDFAVTGLVTVPGFPIDFAGSFTASATQPQVVSANTLDEGQILVTFTDVMLVDSDLLNPREYQLTGPGSPYVESVATVGPSQVVLYTRNIQGGSYSLTVGTNTPHDLAGNPIDPFFDTVAFTTSQPIDDRSIFTDFGPIARPPLTLEVGTGVKFVNYQTVQLTGAALPASYAGFILTLSGTALNNGQYRILTVKSQNTVMVVASFNLPDIHAATASWSVVNPRDGEIADDPAHVTVTINGFPVIPEEVVGLLGQIVLPSAPPHGQDVQVGYSWILNPEVEIRRLNSKEFRLNSWNRDLGYIPDEEHYRFNNVLPVPTNFTSPPPVQQGSAASVVSSSQVYLPDGNVLTDYAGLNLVLTAGINSGTYDIVSVPDSHHVNVSGTLNPADPLNGHIPWTIGDTSDIQAILPQPLLRDLKYRAYERAYTALLNDPNTLTLNAPTNLIAYPPLSRIVAQTFVSYESSGLPENDTVAPWTRVGTGTAVVTALQLVVTSPTAGTFPGGTPIYWVREVDETFPHVFAATWDMQVNADPVPQGVFTGVAFGYSDSERAIVFGYLDNGGTHMVGFMVQGAGNDPSALTAWTGGLDSLGNPTNAPLAYEWETLTSYRIYNDSSGNVSLYLNGSVVPSLMVTQDQLPFLEELAAPFNALQGVFFGSLSAQAESTSTWNFVRYLVLPLNPLQTAPSIFVDYVANILPEQAFRPWTPVGYHGVETILASAFLLLDSVSAVPPAEEILTGLVGGDFRGYFRLEPLIATSAEVVVDFNVQLRTWTMGFDPNALMVAIDDSNRLIQLSFISDLAAPKFSYSGDGFPTTQTPPWTALGTQTAQMLGRTLQIIDASTTDGLVYVIDDSNPVTSDTTNHVAQAAIVANSSLAFPIHHVAVVSMTANSTFFPDLVPHFFAVSDIVADSSVMATATLHHTPVHYSASASIQASAVVNAQVLVSPHKRILSPDNSYILEARLRPLTWTPDPSGFIGAMAEVYDSQRTVGFALYSIAGTLYVALQGDGTVVELIPFNWNDGKYHTYRVAYSPAVPSGVVSLFIDGLLMGAPLDYLSFPALFPPSTMGFVAFGSSSPGTESISTVNWIYCNAWRVEAGQKFVGIWRGTTTGTLIDYWVPTKITSMNALILGNALMDTNVNFVTADVQITDYLIVDVGLNAGIYQVTGVNPNTLTIDALWPSAPSRVNYRIARQTDWTESHGYRIVKAPSGDEIAVFLDSSQTPLILLTYDDQILPPSTAGLPRIIAGTLPSVVWGAFDPSNLSQSSWQYFRYGVTRSPTELRIVPPHQVLNQRNLIQSFERHQSNLPHTLTDFWSESEGITPNTYPDFLTNPGLTAYTLLNEITPLVPQTQTYQVNTPSPTIIFIGGLNNIANVLNSNAFLLNDATQRVALIIPNDVLYDSLQIIERDTGQPNLIAPFSDECQPTYGTIFYQNEVCLIYDAQTLPENDPTAITPWSFFAQNPAHVNRSVFGGVLTYGTDGIGSQTVYTNATPLPDAPSLESQVTFRLKLLQDSSGGLGDSQVRFGFSAIGLTASLALLSAPTGLRYVLVVDQNTNQVLGGIPFDFYDGNYHTYRIVRSPGVGTVQVFVDS